MALYVIHYVTKVEPTQIDKELVELYRNAVESDSAEVKSLMTKISTQVIGRRVQSQQEASLKFLVQNLIYSSRTVISMDTRVPEERNRMLKLNQELDLLDMGEKKLYRTVMIDYYYGRPKNAEFDNICAAQFFA